MTPRNTTQKVNFIYSLISNLQRNKDKENLEKMYQLAVQITVNDMLYNNGLEK
jgi:hypothetical protein